MTKIVIGVNFMGFCLSEEACKLLSAKKGELVDTYDFEKEAMRADADLVSVVETLGEAANGKLEDGSCADLRVVEIPDEATDYKIMTVSYHCDNEALWFVVDGKIHKASPNKPKTE